jgi:hypothetical protein
MDTCSMMSGSRRPSSFPTRRQVLHNVLKYAVIWMRLSSIPLNDPGLHWERLSDMDADHQVDPRSVGNIRQVEQIFTAVSYMDRGQGLRFTAMCSARRVRPAHRLPPDEQPARPLSPIPHPA